MQRNKIQKYMIALGSLLLTACLQKPISEPLQDQPSAEKQQKPDSETLLVRVVNGKRFEIPKGYFDSDEPEPYLENFGNDPNNKVSSRIEPLKFELPSWQPQTLRTKSDCVATYTHQRTIHRSQFDLINDCEKQSLQMYWGFYDRSSFVFDGPKPSDAQFTSSLLPHLIEGKVESEPIYGLQSFYAPSTSQNNLSDSYIYPSVKSPTTVINCTSKNIKDINDSNSNKNSFIASCTQSFIMEDLQVKVSIGYHRSRLPQWQDMEAKMRTWIKQHQVQS